MSQISLKVVTGEMIGRKQVFKCIESAFGLKGEKFIIMNINEYSNRFVKACPECFDDMTNGNYCSACGREL